jgi:hypothetical protein
MPIPGEPDAPKLWLVKTTDSSFAVEWSEPKSYGIPVIGFQLYIEGKKAGDMIAVNLRRAEIPSNINRIYEVNVCAVTNNPQRSRSGMSQTLSVITTPTTNLLPPMYHNNDESSPRSFDRDIGRSIPIEIESINEEKLHIDWTSFLPTMAIRAYYIHYTCLNNNEVQTMKVAKRHRHAVSEGKIDKGVSAGTQHAGTSAPAQHLGTCSAPTAPIGTYGTQSAPTAHFTMSTFGTFSTFDHISTIFSAFSASGGKI